MYKSKKMSSVSHVVCMSRNSVIGINNSLPWDIDYDKKRFKYLTMGKNLLMGRNTFESLPVKLEGRTVYVVTRTESLNKQSGGYPVYARSIEEVLDRVVEGSHLMIAGGESIYKATLDLVDDIFLTVIDEDFEGDSHYFPLETLLKDFRIDYDRYIEAKLPLRFLRLERVFK